MKKAVILSILILILMQFCITCSKSEPSPSARPTAQAEQNQRRYGGPGFSQPQPSTYRGGSGYRTYGGYYGGGYRVSLSPVFLVYINANDVGNEIFNGTYRKYVVNKHDETRYTLFFDIGIVLNNTVINNITITNSQNRNISVNNAKLATGTINALVVDNREDNKQYGSCVVKQQNNKLIIVFNRFIKIIGTYAHNIVILLP